MSLSLITQSGTRKHLVPDSLTHSAGTITAIFGSKVYQAILSGLVAHTRYQLYLIPNGTMVFSTNENSVGPTGQSSWILVGSFYANGETSVAFGSFVKIEDEPKTDNWVRFIVPKLNFTVGAENCRWKRKGRDIILKYFWALNATPTGTIYVETPFDFDPGEFDYSANDGHIGTATGNTSPSANYHGHVQPVLSSKRLRIVSNAGNEWANGVPVAWGSGSRMSLHTYHIPVAGWSGTPIKDL